jgi:hypothetical protein
MEFYGKRRSVEIMHNEKLNAVRTSSYLLNNSKNLEIPALVGGKN